MLFWNEIEGQDAAKAVLERAVDTERVHHAYLFCGPDGVGKRQCALAFAAVLNCKARKDAFEPQCGKCTNCVRIASNQHPDLLLVEAQGQFIKIDQVRVVQKAASHRPYESRFQVIIIDEAHRMTDEAANALLKTLEEPPLTMRIILVSSQPHLMLDTIRSRCQMLTFASLNPEILSRLVQNLEGAAELDQDSRRVAAQLAEGSLGRAKLVLDSGILEKRKSALSLLGNLNIDHPASLIDAAESFGRSRDDLRETLEIFRILLRDILLARTVPDSGWQALAINTDLQDEVQALAARTNLDALLVGLEAVGKASDLVDRNVNTTLIAEELLLNLSPQFTQPHSLT